MTSRLRQSTTATPRPGRHSTAVPTPVRRTQGQHHAEVPEYQAPAHPLNAAGQQALANLLQSRKHAAFDKRIQDAIDALSENAMAINDTVREKDAVVRKDRARHDKEMPEDEEDGERVKKLEEDLENMREKINEMTEKMDHDLRKMLDTREYFNSIKPTLQEITNETATFASANLTHTQPTQGRSQRRTQRNPDTSDVDDEYHDFDPTDPTNAQTQSTQLPPAPTTLFKTKLERRRDRYQNLSDRQRYAGDNDYRQFKRVVHDARYGDTLPLANENTWFNDGAAAPQPGVTATAEDSDDDLQVSKETISTKCPLTLQEFRDPLTSRLCPHSFEKEAILSMIDNPTNTMFVGGSSRRGARDGSRAVQCPVPGCDSILTKENLHSDPVLVRKIRRIQRANQEAEDAEDDEDDEDGGRSRPQEIESGGSEDEGADIDDVDRREQEANAKRIKLERFSGRTPAR